MPKVPKRTEWNGSKTYIGDAVYAVVEGGLLKLTVEYENGKPVHTIYLDNSVLERLLTLVTGEEHGDGG